MLINNVAYIAIIVHKSPIYVLYSKLAIQGISKCNYIENIIISIRFNIMSFLQLHLVQSISLRLFINIVNLRSIVHLFLMLPFYELHNKSVNQSTISLLFDVLQMNFDSLHVVK